MGSVPILLGYAVQKVKGRTGAVWWFLSFVVMVVAYVLTTAFYKEGVSSGLAGAVLFGALPLSIIVATLPVRSPG